MIFFQHLKVWCWLQRKSYRSWLCKCAFMFQGSNGSNTNGPWKWNLCIIIIKIISTLMWYRTSIVTSEEYVEMGSVTFWFVWSEHCVFMSRNKRVFAWDQETRDGHLLPLCKNEKEGRWLWYVLLKYVHNVALWGG